MTASARSPTNGGAVRTRATEITENTGNRRAVLVVDDSAYTRSRLRRFMAGQGWSEIEIIEASDGDEALERYAEERPDLVLIDLIMRGRGGIETARLLLEDDPGARIVMLTVVSDTETRDRALQAGILRVVTKSDWDALRDVLQEELHA